MLTSRIARRFASQPMPRGLPWALLALLLLAVAPTVWAQSVVGNGKSASEVRNPGEFSSIGLSGDMALKLTQGSPASVVVHGDSNLLALLETVVEGDQSLKLRWRRGVSVRSHAPVIVEVVAPQVQAVSSAGSGRIEIDALKVPRLSLSINGSGDVHAKGLSIDDLAIGIAGSSALKLAGRASHMAIELSGTGDIDAGDLRSDDVTVTLAGSGDARVHASRTLTVSIAGSGNVLYSGEPRVQRSIAGSGSVRKR